jgi:hypothetical protein
MRISLAIPALCLLAGQLNMQAQKSQPSSPAANYGNLPLSFEANQGQIDPHVQFLARGQGYSLFLTDSTAVLALTKAPAPTKNSGNPHHSSAATEKDVVRMEVVGASTGLHVAGAKQLPGIANYYIGNDPAKWHSNIPTYAQVKYSGVYPGIDLVYYGDHGQLEYDFIVAPGADPKPMELRFSRGQKLHLNANGDLTIKAHSGQIAFHKPFVYQTRNGKREAVEGRFTLMAKNAVGFELGAYDHDRELVIDPTLAYSTYLGGSGVISTSTHNYGDYARTMTVDGDGNAYVAGDAMSQDFPVTGNAFQKQNYPGSATYMGGIGYGNIGDSFISKLNAAGSALIYSTYFGGSGDPGPSLPRINLDRVNSIAIDGYGNAYVTGQASSPNFPTTPGAFQTVNGYPNASRAFVTKLSTAGPLVYSTLLGGNNSQADGEGIAVDSLGNAYVAGTTDAYIGEYGYANDFPTTPGAFQQTFKAVASTGFVTKLNPIGTALIYSTLLGGSDGDQANSISVDKSGDAYVAGYAGSSDFPTTPGAYETTYNPYSTFSFVTKLNPEGSGLIYSTFFPVNTDSSTAPSSSVAVDGSGNVYTVADKGPVTSGAFQTSGHGWVGKLNASGTALVYGTYVGGRPSVGPPGDLTAIAVDQQGHAFVAGYSYGGFPVTADAFQENYKGVARGEIPTNAVLAEVNADGTALLYGTYLGGSGVSLPHRSEPNDLNGDVSFALAVDSTGNVYMAGSTISNDFPVTSGAFQTTNPAAAISTTNAFISKFAFHGATTTTLTSNANPEDAAAELNLTATVAPVDGTGVPTGIVNFLIDGQTQAKITLDGSGTAVYSTTTLPVGSHSVVASYYGAPRLYSSSNAALTETIVGQVATPTFAAVGGTYPPAHASPVVIQTSTPGATIYYTTNGTMPSTTSAVYSAPIPITATTTYKAIAVESGDTSSGVATATFAIVANAIKTTTSLVSSVNPSLLDEAVTFTATVSAVSGPVPAGTVTFKHGAVVMGTVPLVGGVAHISTSDLELLGHTISAIYTGSATDAWSGQELIQNVTQ